MVIYGQINLMKSVKISELKSKLSSFLKQVRNGAEVIVLDRDTPIAKVVPYPADEDKFTTIPPVHGFKGIEKIKILSLKKKINSLKLLLEDRRKR